MLAKDTLKGKIIMQWYQDGRMMLELPNDAAVAYAMLKFAEDEVQERMRDLKEKQKLSEKLAVVSNDGAHPKPEWGR